MSNYASLFILYAMRHGQIQNTRMLLTGDDPSHALHDPAH